MLAEHYRYPYNPQPQISGYQNYPLSIFHKYRIPTDYVGLEGAELAFLNSWRNHANVRNQQA